MYTAEDLSVLHEDLQLEYYQVPTETHREQLFKKYQDYLEVTKNLNRSLISFQANKNEPFYRWFKYKEGFSNSFVKTMLQHFGNSHTGQVVLDPFSGIGTTITTSIQNGFDAIGVELLAPGILATQARIAATKINKTLLNSAIADLRVLNFEDKKVAEKYFFHHLTITKGAFSLKTEIALASVNRFIDQKCGDENLKALLRFAVSSVLEDVSFTRKDGQYLRWDFRSERKLKSKFNKGKIHELKPRLLEKLEMIQGDIQFQDSSYNSGKYNLLNGSCLYRLQEVKSQSVDLIITSPPYCNRYDYTRTYALELAYDGVDDQEVKELRQTLLSATVENKSKYQQLKKTYEETGKKDEFVEAVEIFRNQMALKEVLASLNAHKSELNNKNIPAMVSNYFFEMNFVIREMSRSLKEGGTVVMVNDNVRYNGDEIPVDLILSEFARKAGLRTKKIWVLERGKGNSSQQMGVHGRKELRKCVYVWSKID